MKMWKILPVAAALFLGTQTFAWAQETSGETTKTEKKESEVEQDLKRLREWVRQQSEKVATTTRAEWPSIKSDFARHADKIESGFQQLSEESKREYVELKAKFNDLESKPFYDEVPLQAEEVKRREKELLGQFSNI
ncbi:MAG: hypothetical protein ACO1OQ_10050, partial [Rufibacter sp.]